MANKFDHTLNFTSFVTQAPSPQGATFDRKSCKLRILQSSGLRRIFPHHRLLVLQYSM
ncbi:MAG: hypothetical protein H7061_08870 [Bdellovibrionaceae bacterium]|nr:hypothetical protein [Bdellovibrio sp.]